MTATAEGAARALRDATRPGHDATEHAPFMAALLGGALPRGAYADLLAQLHAVYEALEAAGARFAGDPVASAFVDPALHRLPAIERDLAHLAGREWRARLPVSGAAAAYASRIAGCAAATAFVAHHYTRYLGDLSGGQVIGRVVRRAYALDGGGAAFYEFERVADPKAYKAAYRARLDAAGLDGDALAAEVAVAYDLNAAVFAALAERHLG